MFRVYARTYPQIREIRSKTGHYDPLQATPDYRIAIMEHFNRAKQSVLKAEEHDPEFMSQQIKQIHDNILPLAAKIFKGNRQYPRQ